MSESHKTVKSVTRDAYNLVRKWNKFGYWCLLASAFIIIGIEIYRNLPVEYHLLPVKLIPWVKYSQVLFIIFYHLCCLYASVLHYEAGKVHFPDFLDNAFGSKLTTKHSENFYADPDMRKGAQSLSLHTAENCFFTKTIFNYMKKGQITNAVIVLIVCIVAMFADFGDWILFFFKLTVPIVWIKKAIVFLYARHEFNRMYQEIYKIMTQPSSQSNLMANSIHILLQFETLKAWLNYPSSEKVYEKHKDEINANFKIERESYHKY